MANKYQRINASNRLDIATKSTLLKLFRANYASTVVKADIVAATTATIFTITVPPNSFFLVDGVLIGTGTASLTLSGTGATAIGFPATQVLTNAVRLNGSIITGANPGVLTVAGTGAGTTTLAKGSFYVTHEAE